MDEKIVEKKKRKRSSRSKKGKPFNEALAEKRKVRYRSPEQMAVAARVCAIMREKKALLPPRLRQRAGVFDGMRREQSDKIWADARATAEKVIRKMKDKGIITPQDDPRAVKALEEAVAVMETSAHTQLRLAAARLILDFTKSKPVMKTEHTINAAEQWLDAISDDDTEHEASPDTEPSA